jgi:hypothetical protein
LQAELDSSHIIHKQDDGLPSKANIVILSNQFQLVHATTVNNASTMNTMFEIVKNNTNNLQQVVSDTFIQGRFLPNISSTSSDSQQKSNFSSGKLTTNYPVNFPAYFMFQI